jgi:hypothetical protein
MTAGGVDSIGRGIIIGLGCALLVIPASFIASLFAGLGALMVLYDGVTFFGLTQLVFLIPAIVIFAGKRQYLTVKGSCIMGSATCALNLIRFLLISRPNLPY